MNEKSFDKLFASGILLRDLSYKYKLELYKGNYYDAEFFASLAHLEVELIEARLQTLNLIKLREVQAVS